MNMKIIFKRDVDCDFYDHRLEEEWPKVFKRWQEVRASDVEENGSLVNIALSDGDSIMNVPRNAIDIVS